MRNIMVRRRRYGDQVHLILENYYLLVDDVPDFIWLSIDGQKTIAQIAQAVADNFGCAPAAAVDAVCEVMGMLAAQTVVTMAEDAP